MDLADRRSAAACIVGLVCAAWLLVPAASHPASAAPAGQATPGACGGSLHRLATDCDLPFTAQRLNPTLIDALRGGGYVIFLRHAPTDMTQRDTDPENLANCATQRNLNDEGRQLARRLGEAFRALNIPVGQVLSSGYCRTQETARLAFGQAEVVPELNMYRAQTSAEDTQHAARVLRSLLETPPQAGTNRVVVSHGANLWALTGLNLDQEGEVAIYVPFAQGPMTLVADILPTEWISQAQQ